MANTTWSPTDLLNTTLSGGNLIATQTAANGGVRSAHGVTSGKYYWETTITINQSNTGFGIANSSAVLSTANSTSAINACTVQFGGTILLNGTNPGVNIGILTNNGALCFALDMTAKRFWIRNGAAGQWNNGGTANPATGVGGLDISSIATGAIYAFFDTGPNGPAEKATANFGDSAFVGTVPSGYTSGFPASPTAGRVTQAALEQWSQGDPAARTTQQAVEVWSALAFTAGQAVVTLVSVEQWAVVTTTTTVAEQYAVTVIT